MEIEFQEIHDFLSQQALFDELPPASLNKIVGNLSIRYLRRGQKFPPTDVDSSYLYVIRSGAIELRDDSETLLEKLGEGDCHTTPCISGQQIIAGHASEDCLIYMIPCEIIQSLRDESTEFEKHFVDSVQKRMKLAIEQRQTSNSMQLYVKELSDREPIAIDASTSIADAATEMTDRNISSILITQDKQLVGIITDRDFRRRCLAKGVSRKNPVSEIMTTELITIPEHTVLSDALLLMTRHKIHHLPVLKNGKPVGNLSVSDLMHYLGTNSALVASDIEKANSVERLAQISGHLPELQLQLAMANTPAQQTGEVLSAITDSLTCRLLKLAEQKYGAPPVPYVWLAGGSQGRNEQTVHSDQDNAMFISDQMHSDHNEYFANLSQYVSDGLNACGYVYCPGQAMASNPKWRQPTRVWRKYFSTWIQEPEKKALMLSSIFFDLRPVYGDFSLFNSVHKEILEKTRANRIFIAYMVSNALEHTPPLGFFRNFVLIRDQKHDRTLDIKHRGIVPVVDIARIYALAEGIEQSNTSERLRSANETGSLSQEMSENLIDALEYMSSLRIQHQAQQIRRGIALDNYFDPKLLSGLERGHLKDAFIIIKDMQQVLENRHQAARIG